jgi:alpha-L-fucosidase 2
MMGVQKNSSLQLFWRFFFIIICVGIGQVQAQTNDLRIWYTAPAQNWNEALPVGNGRLGAMIFGGTAVERLQLNEGSVWSGKDVDFVHPDAKAALPEVRKLLFEGKYKEAKDLAEAKLMGNKSVASSYQTLGDLVFNFNHASPVYKNYTRDLDLETATASTSYTNNGIRFRRSVFSSAPDQVLVIKLDADQQNAISFTATMSRPGDQATFSVNGDELLMEEHVGNGSGVKLTARIKVVQHGGKITTTKNGFVVDGANDVMIVIAAATDYWGQDPEENTTAAIQSSLKKGYADLLKDHVADYQRYFNRVAFSLRSEGSSLPTDQRLINMQRGITDPHLVELYYQFGRYLLISSSRPGGLPANLQGIWADGLTPPWDADYHININIQMNYWLSELTNLSELHQPFLDFIDALRPDARKTAKDMYGIEGTVAHFTTDAWHFTEPYGRTQWAMWPMGMAWCADHMWQHYQFTNDKKFLGKQGYPVMKDAAFFCMNWLTEDPISKQLVSGPSISPENTFVTPTGDTATMVMGPTMDHMIIRQLLTNTREAARVLNMDKDLQKKIDRTLARLAPTRISSDGRIMEWTREFREPEPGHRHISHLYGLHPGNEISIANPLLMKAARKTIDYRLSHGGGHTGWSRAWIINFFARLGDGNACLENLDALLKKSTLPNLFDSHPPFQIDGNFGAVSGITEMLLQSHTGEIVILPALPSEWKNGSIKGICARGGFELDITWGDGVLEKLVIRSRDGLPCKVRYGDTVKSFDTAAGETLMLSSSLQQVKK